MTMLVMTTATRVMMRMAMPTDDDAGDGDDDAGRPGPANRILCMHKASRRPSLYVMIEDGTRPVLSDLMEDGRWATPSVMSESDR